MGQLVILRKKSDTRKPILPDRGGTRTFSKDLIERAEGKREYPAMDSKEGWKEGSLIIFGDIIIRGMGNHSIKWTRYLGFTTAYMRADGQEPLLVTRRSAKEEIVNFRDAVERDLLYLKACGEQERFKRLNDFVKTYQFPLGSANGKNGNQK